MSLPMANRILMPKPPGDPPCPPPPPRPERTVKRKRASEACAPCRTRKTKCDAMQPSCGECTKRHTSCIYELTPAKRKFDDLETRAEKAESSQHVSQQLISALQSRPEADAQAILRRLREGHDIESIVRYITAGDLLLQLSVEPETRFRFVFPFRHDMPSFLQTADNQYLGSVLYQTAFTIPEGQGSSTQPMNELYGPEYLKPYSSAAIIDPKLEAVKPSQWTQVSADDDLLRLLLKLYFQYEYPSWPMFQKDLFLEDMLSGSKSNCSSLLVNVVLVNACHCHMALPDRREYWNSRSLGYKFLAEAKRLWEEESRKSHITTIQAGMLIFSLYSMYSMDKLGMTYAVQAAIMTNDLDLLGPPRQTWSQRKKHAYSFTAWAVYCYFSIVCYHFNIARLVREPPKTPLPTCDADPAWFGEFYFRYPLSRALTPMHFGHAFRSRVTLSIIMNELGHHLFDEEDGEKNIAQGLMLCTSKLREWYAALPAELAPQKIVFPFQLELHALYRNVMIHTCEAILNAKVPPEKTTLLANLASIVQTYKICLETIMRLYYLRHGFEKSDIYSAHFLSHLASNSIERLKVLQHTDSPRSSEGLKEAQSTVILAVKGLRDQGQNYYLPYTIFHMFCKAMGQEEVDILHQYTGIAKDDLSSSKLRVKHVQCQYPIKIFSSKDDAEHVRLEELVNRYADLALEASGSDMSGIDSS